MTVTFCGPRLWKVIESQNHSVWKSPLSSPGPAATPALPSPALTHGPQHRIHAGSKHLQGWRRHHLPGQPVPTLHHPSREEIFPIPNLNLPRRNVRPFPLVLSLVIREKRPTPAAYGPCQVAAESDQVPPEPPPLQANPPRSLSRPSQGWCPSPCPSPLPGSGHAPAPPRPPAVRGPKLNTGVQGRPHRCPAQEDGRPPLLLRSTGRAGRWRHTPAVSKGSGQIPPGRRRSATQSRSDHYMSRRAAGAAGPTAARQASCPATRLLGARPGPRRYPALPGSKARHRPPRRSSPAPRLPRRAGAPAVRRPAVRHPRRRPTAAVRRGPGGGRGGGGLPSRGARLGSAAAPG
ncbi:translin-associated protein X isoform X1 [Falco peregrinus]|uniref:translin-associated protein X isoform X1 n=1 Tax=Falco peregrinus TaxID=8954 RepID=UPI00247B0331|nr:translin-associated protein X isoform X1 [Falco peregrinus]